MNQVTARWAKNQQELCLHWAVDPLTGLNEEQAAARLKAHGPNQLVSTKGPSFWHRIWSQLASPLVGILAVAVLLSFALQEWTDGFAILTILIINSFIGYIQEKKADQALEALRSMTHPQAKVLRSGHMREISAPEIVPGDILILEAGDSVVADALVLHTSHLSVDESMLTGESLPIDKEPLARDQSTQDLGQDADSRSKLFAGTAVTRGSGRALVIATGMNSQMGAMAKLMEAAQKATTPLQKRMAEASNVLLLLAGGVILLMLGLGVIHGEAWQSILLGALSLAVAAVPEGLPTVVTIALALAVRRMSERNVIIRHLPSVETLGSCDVICTDKTGTLTTGQMEVRELLNSNGQLMTSESLLSGAEHDPKLWQPLLETAILSSTASYHPSQGAAGDTTEVALIRLAVKCGMNPKVLRESLPPLAEWSFDSHRKRMSFARQIKDQTRLCVKGAPESVLPLCKLSPGERQSIEDHIQILSRQGRRILALAHKILVLPSESQQSLQTLAASEVEKDLEFIGLAALADPPRTESRDSIRACQAAGIKVVMITGDHALTADAIAKELEIIPPGTSQAVISGPELDRLTADELLQRVDKIAVYARVSPEHKLRIIEAWKARGSVVAMTGDGVNDAAALKAASIGIAMGKGGTEVARQAASLVLTDDNFATIVAAIEEGRGVYGNIKRTVLYLLTGNFAEICIMFVASLAAMPFPLWPIHLLWINLVTDGLPSLALAAEPNPGKHSLRNIARPSASSFFDRSFYLETLLMGLTISVIGLSLYQSVLRQHDLATARTAIFSFVVFEELFRSFASRSADTVFLSFRLPRNYFHLISVILPLGLHLWILSSPVLAPIFKTSPLPADELLKLLAWALIPVTLIELKKLFKIASQRQHLDSE